VQLMIDLVGRTLGGRYRLDARRAAGVSGDAYTAFDVLLQREVVVKVATGEASRPAAWSSWRMVAQAAARLSHPNVVRVHDWGVEDDLVYLVTEPTTGTDARDLLVAKGSIEPLQAAEIVACVCDALVASHSLGLIHHDIRPENILISSTGHVKVADFGIAPVARERHSISSGMASGIRYMSPEEAAGLPPTASSDIWAAGAVLAEMLTGSPPQQGSGSELATRRAAEHMLPPSLIEPRVPKELDEIVLRACALDPADRYADASDMAHALRRASVRSLPDAPEVEELIDEITGEIHLPDLEYPRESRKRKPAHQRKKGLRVGRLALLMLVLGSLVTAAVIGFSAFLAPDMVEVPPLEGMTLADARGRALDFDLAVTEREYHDSIPRGAVIAQDPENGEAEEGSGIGVVLSMGPPPVKVPKVEGLATAKARTEIEAIDLVVGKTMHRYAPLPTGKVVKQLPANGKLEVGSEVHLVISKGPRPVELPAIAGAPAADATDALSEVGLRAKILEVYSEDAQEGLVVYTEPAAGETVSRGQEVEVYVSAGPRFEDVTVPDVRNMSAERATDTLEAAGLTGGVVRSCGGGSELVVDTAPVPGSTLQENDSVTLFLC
jgi:eukaryotic-like serine/threonine-protein kinase